MKPDIHAAQQRQLSGLRARLIESIQRAQAKRVAAATGKITREKINDKGRRQAPLGNAKVLGKWMRKLSS